MTGRARATILWLRVFAWCALIFAFSANPNFKGQHVNFGTVLGVLDFLSRKTCHLVEYFVLMVFAYRAFQGNEPETRDGHFLWCFFFVLMYAVSDEWHQTFVFGRSGSAFDVFVDSVGAFAAYIYVYRKDLKKCHIKN